MKKKKKRLTRSDITRSVLNEIYDALYLTYDGRYDAAKGWHPELLDDIAAAVRRWKPDPKKVFTIGDRLCD